MPHDDLGSQFCEVTTRTSELPGVDRAIEVTPWTRASATTLAAPDDPAAVARALLGEPARRVRDPLSLLAGTLVGLGFTVRELWVPGDPPGDRTLFARLGDSGPHVGFAAHVGASPTGDMKGAVAGFVAAAARLQAEHAAGCPGSISLLLTSAPADTATATISAVIDWLADRGELPDLCIVGEPTSRERLGDVIKIGCRGQLHGVVTVQGRAGHTACPELADNPVSRLLRFLARLDEAHLDQGSAQFPPSSLTITTVDVGNRVSHVIPASASAAFEIRYNDHHTRTSLESWLRRLAVAQLGPDHHLDLHGTGDTLVKPPGVLSEAVCAAISAVTGQRPAIDTGSQDAGLRQIRRRCPVVEFGPRSETMHEADEQVALAELEQLTRVYHTVLSRLLVEDTRRARTSARSELTQGTPGRITPSAVFSSISLCLQGAASAL